MKRGRKQMHCSTEEMISERSGRRMRVLRVPLVVVSLSSPVEASYRDVLPLIPFRCSLHQTNHSIGHCISLT